MPIDRFKIAMQKESGISDASSKNAKKPPSFANFRVLMAKLLFLLLVALDGTRVLIFKDFQGKRQRVCVCVWVK